MSLFPTELYCIYFLILLFHFKSFFSSLFLCRSIQWTYYICFRQAKLPISVNKKNSRNTWVSVQMEGPRITSTELSLLIKSSFKDGKAIYVLLVHGLSKDTSKLNGCFRNLSLYMAECLTPLSLHKHRTDHSVIK